MTKNPFLKEAKGPNLANVDQFFKFLAEIGSYGELHILYFIHLENFGSHFVGQKYGCPSQTFLPSFPSRVSVTPSSR